MSADESPNSPSDRDPHEEARRIEFLRDGRPSEILGRLVESDPLALRPRSRTRLAALGHVLPEERLALRAMARVAFEARRRPRDVGLDVWLDGCVDVSIRELIDEQLAEERALEPIEASRDADFYRALGGALSIEPGLARLACVRLNGLTRDRRQVFHALAIERATLEQCVARGLGSESRVLELFHQAVLQITRAFESRGANGPWSPLA